MPISDLFCRSRRILRKLLGRSRRASLAAALVPLGAIGMSTVHAAPSITLPPQFPATPFSIRVTDMERVPGDLDEDAFRVEFQALNWAHFQLDSIVVASNVGSTAVDAQAPRFSAAAIDADGRGGTPGGSHIGLGVFDPVAIHSGRGRGDLPNMLNDWLVNNVSDTFVQWSAYDTTQPGAFPVGSPLSSRDLLWQFATPSYVPGFGVDALGDSAMDGGPTPYTPSSPGGGPPNIRYVIDGFVIDVDDWDVGEVFSLNWTLAGVGNTSAGWHPLNNPFHPLGGHDGQSFGFGVMNLARIEPSIGSPPGSLPGAVFVDNEGFNQSSFSFYDTVYEIPNPAEFAAEFGAGITAPFLNPADNVFNAQVNTRLVPEPVTMILVGAGLGAVGVCRRRHRAPSRQSAVPRS